MDLKFRTKALRERWGASRAYTAVRLKWTFLALGLLFGHGTAVGAEIESYAIVQDDATLWVQGKRIRLFGVYPVDLRRFCDDTFRPVRCQTRAAVALASEPVKRFYALTCAYVPFSSSARQ